LLTASTPVMAVHTLAKERISSHQFTHKLPFPFTGRIQKVTVELK
jgi:hypothetical protein